MAKLIFGFASASLASCVRAVQVTHANISNLKIQQEFANVEIFVINMKARSDRCRCMRDQLFQNSEMPWRVHRYEAEDSVSCDLKFQNGSARGAAKAGLFCSNYHIWKKAADKNLDALIIFEDDAILKPNWWQTVNDLIHSQCNNTVWNYLRVDPIRNRGHRTLEDQCEKVEQYSGIGSHMQILKGSYLKTLVHNAETNGLHLMDIWFKWTDNSELAFNWMPNIAAQASLGDRAMGPEWEQFLNETGPLPSDCTTPSFHKSDLYHGKLSESAQDFKCDE